VANLLRQAHKADFEADRDVEQALTELQTQNRVLRVALGFPVSPADEDKKELIFTLEDGQVPVNEEERAI
jgi:hypothetical protein